MKEYCRNANPTFKASKMSELDLYLTQAIPIQRGSVGIIVLNFKKHLLTIQCIQSLKAQTYTDAEILLVDNASQDGSVESFRTLHPELQLLESRLNRGYAGGNNLGIRKYLEEGKEFIWILNNDTIAPPNALLRLVEALRANSRWGMAGSQIKAPEQPQATLQMGGGRVSLWSGLNQAIVNAADLSGLNYLTGCSLLIRTEALRKVGLMDENYFHYWEDVDLSFRMQKGGWELGYVPDSVIYHHEGGSLATHSPRAAFFYSRSVVRFFLQNSPHPIRPILISTFLRFGKALLHLRFKLALSVLRGVWQGIHRYPLPYTSE